MKTPEEIAREIVEKWIESFSSHTSEVLLGDQLNLEEAIAQAITQERSRAKKLVEALEFYAGREWSDTDMDIFDYFSCNHKGGQSFDSNKFCERARQALAEYESGK